MLIWLHDEACALIILCLQLPWGKGLYSSGMMRCSGRWITASRNASFIYEALTALPVDIIAGPTVEVLRGLAAGG